MTAVIGSGVGLLRHLRNYLSAGVLTALVGLVSFPLLTRALSVEQYGILGLITATLTLFVALGKLGMQHAIIRFYPQVREGNSAFDLRQMYATVLMSFLFLAAMTSLIWLVSGFQIMPLWMSYPDVSELFVVATGIVFLRLLASSLLNFLRAEQRSERVAIAMSLARIGTLVFIVFAVLALQLDPWTALCCMVLGEGLSIAYAAWAWRDTPRFSPRDFSTRLFVSMVRYGLPLMLLETLGLVLRLSDRYMIESMLGVVPLGQYSASYNLTSYLDLIILMAIVQALRPAYMQLWESEGGEAVKAFLAKGFRLYLVLAIPFVTLFSLLSPHLLALLAGEKYFLGTVIIPLVAISFLLEGCMHWLAAGLYIKKDTHTLMKWGMIATVVNIALNLLLIPRLGISGAAWVTILSYLIFMLGVARAAFKFVAFPISLITPAALAVLCLGVWLLLSNYESASYWQTILTKGIVASPILLALLLLLEPGLWTQSKQLLQGRFARAGGRGT